MIRKIFIQLILMIINSIFIISKTFCFFLNQNLLLRKLLKLQSSSYNLINDLTFQNSYKTINNNADANIMINFKELANTSSIFFKNKLVINNFSSWSCNDLEIKNDLIIANGF